MSAAKEKPPVAPTTEGQPKSVVANGNRHIAHSTAPSKRVDASLANEGAVVAYRASDGRIWRYHGKRGRVLAMLATMPSGVTQWDTLPWHTRLGGTIHAMREDELAIDTEREGTYRHARYRLRTPGSLIIHRDNTGVAA